MNVIVVNDYAHVNGGSAQVALGSAVALAAHGYRVTLFAAVPPVAGELQRSGVRVVVTEQHDIKYDPIRFRAIRQGLWNSKAAKEFAAVLAECTPTETIIHVHGWCKALSSSVVRTAIERDFPLLVTLHDYFYACPGGGFFNFQTRAHCHLRPLSAACLQENCDRDGYPQKLWRSLRQEIQNTLGHFREVRSFITVSSFSEEILRPWLPSAARLYRIPNPVEVDRGPAVNVRSNREFVGVGRLAPEKGFELLAEAARILGCELMFIGDGPSRDALISIYPRSRNTGWRSKQEVRERLKAARALVFPSICYEAQPLVVGEAGAMGIPAIVPDDCAAREWVIDGVTGLWFKSGNVSDLKDKMAILQDDDLVSRMGQAAYDRYWQHPFTMDRHLEALQACYDSILQSRGREARPTLQTVAS